MRRGREQLAVMGCYGIGVSRCFRRIGRTESRRQRGIKWPIPIAPFRNALLPLSQSEPVTQLAESLYRSMEQTGIEVLWDDRDERAGVKFNDARPHRRPFHPGDRREKRVGAGQVELKLRHRAKQENCSGSGHSDTHGTAPSCVLRSTPDPRSPPSRQSHPPTKASSRQGLKMPFACLDPKLRYTDSRKTHRPRNPCTANDSRPASRF